MVIDEQKLLEIRQAATDRLANNLRQIARLVQEQEMPILDALCTAYMLGMQHTQSVESVFCLP